MNQCVISQHSQKPELGGSGRVSEEPHVVVMQHVLVQRGPEAAARLMLTSLCVRFPGMPACLPG
jgi:hypothetical protein